MKQCSKCKEIKELSEFGKDSRNDGGKQSQCVACCNAGQLISRRTKKGVIKLKYRTQKTSSKKRGHSPPEYTFEEFFKWMMSQDIFHELFDNWVKSDYDKNLNPSVDRKDDYKGYSFENIQIMTWKENSDKFHKDHKGGKNTTNYKAIVQMTFEGEFINEFHSIKHASRVVGVSDSDIVQHCKGKRTCLVGGYKWKYKEETI